MPAFQPPLTTPLRLSPPRRARLPVRPIRWRCAAPPPIHPSPPAALRDALAHAPPSPGVYRFLSATAEPLYIGKAKHLRARLRHYLTRTPSTASGVSPAARVSPRIAAMLAHAVSLDYIATPSAAAALALEAALVQEARPPYNVQLKDDRRHPYALLTRSESFPRLLLTRSRRVPHPSDRLYGPFVDETRLRRLLDAVRTAFPLRRRRRPLFSDRPCLNFHTGACPGPCQQLVTPDDYAAAVNSIDKLLSGRVDEVLQDLRAEMQNLSEQMRYEQAASVRDRIALLQRVCFGDAVEGTDTPSSAAGAFAKDAEDVAAIVALDPFVSRDVFAIARSDTAGKVALFQVRGGKVASRLVFSVVPGGHLSAREDLLGAVLSMHYAAAGHAMEIPEEVVLCTPAADVEVLKSALSEKRGKSVSVRMPGPNTASLACIVQHNADMELRLDSKRASDLARDLRDLAEFVTPYFRHLVLNDSEDVDNQDTAEEDHNNLKLHRIEGYDISHTSGSNAIGSMAVFLDGSPAPSEYRKYNLQKTSSSQGHPDDYESLRETLKRRFKGYPVGSYSNAISSSAFPDLLIIDGGKGQLSAAMEALREIGLDELLPVVSIAKGQEEIFVPGRGVAINIDEDTGSCFMNDGIRLVCRVRDEAHRTAVTAHRKRRGRRALRSGLDSISGLGSVKRSVLLDHFNGSSEAVAKASDTDLRKVPGIGPALAKRIFEHFHTTSQS